VGVDDASRVQQSGDEGHGCSSSLKIGCSVWF